MTESPTVPPTLTPAERTELELVARGRQDKSRVLRERHMAETPQSAHALLLRLGIWDVARLPYPDRLNVEVASPALQVPAWPPDPPGGRLDLTHLPALAIDDEGNRDPDDALSLETLEDGTRRLWVHVADVAALVTPDSELDREARRRGATLYLPDRTAGMLPGALVAQVGLGLHPVSPALSISIDFDPEGQADSVDVALSTVRVQRVSYAAAQAQLDAGDPLLGRLLALAEASRALREAEGAISIDLPEVLVKVRAGTDPAVPEIDIQPLSKYQTRFIVQECMTLAGWAAAIYADDLEVALPFATQDPPHRAPPQGERLSTVWARRRTLSRTRFQPRLGPHSGMGLDAYAQATSPIRRYLDLVVHQQLRAHLTGSEGLSGREIAARVAESQMNAGAVRTAERESRRHWLLVALSRQPERVWEGVVVERKGPQAVVLLPEVALDTTLTSAAPLDTTLRVQVAGVDLAGGTFRLREVRD